MTRVPLRNRRILAIVGTDDTYELRRHGDDRFWAGKCIFCGRALTIGDDGEPRSRATIEHIWPRNHGGDDRLENLALACAGCNHEKGVRHDDRRKDDPRLAEISADLARKRRERWRDAAAVGLESHVAWARAQEAAAEERAQRTARRGKRRRGNEPA